MFINFAEFLSLFTDKLIKASYPLVTFICLHVMCVCVSEFRPLAFSNQAGMASCWESNAWFISFLKLKCVEASLQERSDIGTLCHQKGNVAQYIALNNNDLDSYLKGFEHQGQSLGYYYLSSFHSLWKINFCNTLCLSRLQHF